MSNNFENFRKALLSTGLSVSRDKAPKGSSYPYIVYSIASKGRKVASGKTFKRMPFYQVSLFTSGTELDIKVLETALEKFEIPYSAFQSIPGDENDETITNFYTYVRLVENG